MADGKGEDAAHIGAHAGGENLGQEEIAEKAEAHADGQQQGITFHAVAAADQRPAKGGDDEHGRRTEPHPGGHAAAFFFFAENEATKEQDCPYCEQYR